MKAFIARLLAPLVIGSLALTGLGAHSAAAAAVIPAGKIAGSYVLYSDWSNEGYASTYLTLRRNGTGNVGGGSHVTWSRSKRNITIFFTAGTTTATFLGTVMSAGFNSRSHPGTMSTTDGLTGVWYATKS